MVMEARALEASRIGQNEVRITNVYTVEATNEFSTEHDSTPNWKENIAPRFAEGAFRLRIHAEAGRDLGNSGLPYELRIQAVCLTNPAANLVNMNPPLLFETFGGATPWEYQGSEEKFTRDWSIPIPVPATFPLVVGLQNNQTWQYTVSLTHTLAAKTFACSAVSPTFRIL